MDTHDQLLEQFARGYEQYGTQLSLLATQPMETNQLWTKDTLQKLFGDDSRYQLRMFGGPISDDCGKVTDYITRSGCNDEGNQAGNCWHNLAAKAGSWVLSNGKARTTPACRPVLLWSDFVHCTLLGDTAEQVDNVWKYCAFTASVCALRVDKKNEAPALKKSKRSTVKGEAEIKLIAAFTKHHKYNDGSLLNQEPIGVNELGRRAEVAASSASDFFKKKFGGHDKYQQYCRNSKIGTSLKAMNEGFSPDDLFGSKPPGERDREEE